MFDNGLCLAPGKDPVDIVKVINRAYADRVQLSAISVQESSDMPAIYWIEELDETTHDPIIQSAIYPQDHRNVYAMDIGIAGHQRIIATDSSQAFKTNGKQIADMMNDFCKVISNANKVWLKSEIRILECSEMTSYGEQNAYEVMNMQNYPGDVTQFKS